MRGKGIEGVVVCLGVFLAAAVALSAQEIPVAPGAAAVFATVEEARAVLTNRDDFIQALSTFDRSARLKTDQPVSEAEFLKFIGASAREWTEGEKARIQAALRAGTEKIARWKLPFPPKILLVKTSGQEEGGMPYTRQNAILLPEPRLLAPEGALEQLLIHELFHVLSRNSGEFRKELYGVIGFARAEGVDYPAAIRARRITNPDAVDMGWVMALTNQNRTIYAAPILLSATERYEANRGAEFFAYLQVRLLAGEKSGGRWRAQYAGGQAVLLDPMKTPGFFEQIGEPARPVLVQPEEILAAAFVRLATGEADSPGSRILKEMERVLAGRKE